MNVIVSHSDFVFSAVCKTSTKVDKISSVTVTKTTGRRGVDSATEPTATRTCPTRRTTSDTCSDEETPHCLGFYCCCCFPVFFISCVSQYLEGS